MQSIAVRIGAVTAIWLAIGCVVVSAQDAVEERKPAATTAGVFPWQSKSLHVGLHTSFSVLQALPRFWNVRGFSVVEMTTVLSAVAMLSGMAAPAINNYVEEARLIRARSDAQVIAVSLVRMMNDVAGQGRRTRGWAQYDLLAGAGEAPVAATPASSKWSSGDRVGRLDDHLVSNEAGYASPAGRGLGGWRGAYIDGPIAADPWGNRFATNVVTLVTSGASDTVVLSAGPDGTANVPFAADGLRETADDVIVLVSSGSY